LIRFRRGAAMTKVWRALFLLLFFVATIAGCLCLTWDRRSP
jgi:hypothetical protein